MIPQIVCKTIVLAIQTVTFGVACHLKDNKKQEKASKNQQIVCKTIPPAIETVAWQRQVIESGPKSKENPVALAIETVA